MPSNLIQYFGFDEPCLGTTTMKNYKVDILTSVFVGKC